MGGIAVHTVGTPRRDHADFRHGATGINQRTVLLHMLDRMADLHRAGVGA